MRKLRTGRELGSTYRLQLPGLAFAGATKLVPALHALGVGTLYLSPITRARAGSSHGYDVADPTELDPTLGTRADFDALLRSLGEHDMKLLIDIVPNHMATSSDNPFFADVLRRGRKSRYASYFDIDWEQGDGKVVLCVLDGSLSDVLDAGELRVSDGADLQTYRLTYGEQQFPLDSARNGKVLAALRDAADGNGATEREQLEQVLSRQHYRLTDWRRAPEQINYRRFFDINGLIGVRQEDPFVFAATHSAIVEIAADERVGGLRVDHVDGLADPAGYLASLRAAVPVDAVIEVEKIVEREEPLPVGWPIDGTTGYEFATDVINLFVDPSGAEAIRLEQVAATGDSQSFAERAVEAKNGAVTSLFPAPFDRVVTLMARALPEIDREDLATALRWLTVHLGVYRTYRRIGEPVSDADRDQLRAAADAARARLDDRAGAALDRVCDLLLGELVPDGAGHAAVTAWQQLTPAVMAKGVEDTALYEPGGLLALADVGSDPGRTATTLVDFHTAMGRRQRLSPRALSALSTHDSKRSFDTRCRIAVLSELAETWTESVEALDKETAAVEVDPAERRYIYQTLIGTWPISGEVDEAFIERIRGHLNKAVREAKRRSSWLDPDLEHERAVADFIDQLLSDPASASVEILETLVTDIEFAAAVNSLAGVVLRSCAPGVPDIYQNDDAWFLAMTDPDNRAPVDPARLAPSRLAAGPVGLELLHSWRDGRVKQAVIRAALELRRQLPALFAAGEYLPIAARGASADHVVSFERRYREASVVCVVPRLSRTLAGPGQFPTGEVWGDTEIALSSTSGYVDVLTGRGVAASPRASVSDLLAILPVAILRSPA